ncbi:MAG TPA: hypothetical protein VFG96_11005 [Jiangellaceae bacterium]|nr:hypothetical protein [Jiangellaceae bacterium]
MTTGWGDDFDVLPDTTSDERGDSWGETDESDDDRLEQDRPPHWA